MPSSGGSIPGKFCCTTKLKNYNTCVSTHASEALHLSVPSILSCRLPIHLPKMFQFLMCASQLLPSPCPPKTMVSHSRISLQVNNTPPLARKVVQNSLQPMNLALETWQTIRCVYLIMVSVLRQGLIHVIRHPEAQFHTVITARAKNIQITSIIWPMQPIWSFNKPETALF